MNIEPSSCAQTSRSSLWVVVLAAGLWLTMTAVDWTMRFLWYRWQDTVITPSVSAFEGPSRPMSRIEIPEGRGGDLTSLIGLSAVNQRFEQERPATTMLADEYGFQNAPPVVGRRYPIITAGDSFMASGTSMDDLFGARLARISGKAVYNYAYPGRGPLFCVERFLRDGRFATNAPRVLVWGLVEREIGGDIFAGMVSRLASLDQGPTNAAAGGRVNWSALTPRALKESLPSTSAIAQASRKMWNRVRYLLFGAITPEVAISTAAVEGQPILFYTWAVKAMRWTQEQRKPEVMADAVLVLSRVCRERGVTLVVMLIPDKEQVYRDLLPASLRTEGGPIPDSTLNDLEKGLRQRDVPVVNLLGPFREKAREDVLLYWPDDTHWNSRGMELAAQRVWDSIKDGFSR